MGIELKDNCKYSLLVPTSMGVRITPINGQPVHSSETFIMQATSAETNVVSIASYLGLPVKVLTTFVKNSPIAKLIKSNLKARHMDFEGKMLNKVGLGAIVINSMLLIVVLAYVDLGFTTIVQVKLAEL